jgi:hypothetical protein
LKRQLGLEVLASINEVLFPPRPGSENLLKSLVVRVSFDPHMTTFAVTDKSLSAKRDPSFRYLGAKLMDLYDEIENPKARGWVEKWFERRSGARHVMMATFLGVIFAVVLGFLSLGVSLFQAWVGYQAWKHPVQS